MLQYARLVICFSEDRIVGGLKYARLVRGLIEYNSMLVICFSEDRNTGGLYYGRLVIDLNV